MSRSGLTSSHAFHGQGHANQQGPNPLSSSSRFCEDYCSSNLFSRSASSTTQSSPPPSHSPLKPVKEGRAWERHCIQNASNLLVICRAGNSLETETVSVKWLLAAIIMVCSESWVSTAAEWNCALVTNQIWPDVLLVWGVITLWSSGRSSKGTADPDVTGGSLPCGVIIVGFSGICFQNGEVNASVRDREWE